MLYRLQKINYAQMNDGDEDEDDFGNGSPNFDSDDDDDLLENTGVKEADVRQVQLNNSNDMFDSLKEDTPVKKPAPTKRKLGAKAEEVKAPTKRTKKPVAISDSEDSSPVKVSEIDRIRVIKKFV